MKRKVTKEEVILVNKIIENYRKKIASGEMKLISAEKVKKKLGL